MRSFVEIIDADSGAVQLVHASPADLAAPNWTRDGRALLVNGAGRLWRIGIATGEIAAVDTGGCVRLNNDHGLSPDGRWLALSDRAMAEDSCIWVMPLAGGAPRRVTAEVPSWWHGWSPDGETLVYTARRAGGFGIWAIGVAGGAERRLISGAPGGGPAHYDGPDFTPDGAWVWFNSDRGGAMALWRMRPDGSGAEQMTPGDRVDWFPHPAPDGREVAYLSYPPGTEGHPAGREVELRLVPAAGGPARVLARVFGGQGTLNVPSWAPEGRRFAYVRYARPEAAG
jgi:Tol biopolymer transport system component